MRVKRQNVNKRQKMRICVGMILFLMIIPLLSFYLSNNIISNLVDPLYKQLEPTHTESIYVYEVRPLIYYEINVIGPFLSSEVYPINGNNLTAITFSKKNADKLVEALSLVRIKAVSEEKRENSITIPYLEQKHDEVELLDECLNKAILIMDKESQLSVDLITKKYNNDSLPELMKMVDDMERLLDEWDIDCNCKRELEDILVVQKDAVDKLEISTMLNDGKSFYILQKSIYESLDLYKKLIAELEDMRLYNF